MAKKDKENKRGLKLAVVKRTFAEATELQSLYSQRTDSKLREFIAVKLLRTSFLNISLVPL
jgi:hypothetical protein